MIGFISAMLIASAISAAASIGVGITSQAMQNKSVKDANEANKQINEANNAFNAQQADVARQFDAQQADLTRTFNASEAEKQRDFQREMSNTEVQRRVADLQAAGFNPALAVTSGSASTPGAVGATSGMVNGSQASASGFMPMKAMDYSPMAQLSSNLSHMVSSASSLIMLDKMARYNPNVMKNLSKVSNGLSRSVTSAGKAAKLSSVSEGISEDEIRGLINSISR